MKHWIKYHSGKNYKEWVVPSKKGIFLGGNDYASKTISMKRRGTGKYWEVYTIAKGGNTHLLAKKVKKAEAKKVIRVHTHIRRL